MKIRKKQLKQIIKEEVRLAKFDSTFFESRQSPQAMKSLIMKETVSYLTEERQRLFSLLEAEKETAIGVLDANVQVIEKAEVVLVPDLFQDPEALVEQLTSDIEKFLGTDRRLWYDDSGKMKPEYQEELGAPLEKMAGVLKNIRNIARANKPIEKKINSLTVALTTGAAGSLLAGVYGMVYNSVGPRWLGLTRGVDLGHLGGQEMLKVAVLCAVVAFSTYVLTMLIKRSRTAFESLVDSGSWLASVAKTAGKATQFVFGGLKDSLTWMMKKLKGALSRGGPSDSDQGQLTEVLELREIINFVNYCGAKIVI